MLVRDAMCLAGLMTWPVEDRQTWQAVVLWTCLEEPHQLQGQSWPTPVAGSTLLRFAAYQAVFAAPACDVYEAYRHPNASFVLEQIAQECFALRDLCY